MRLTGVFERQDDRAAEGAEQVDELTDRDRAVLALEARQWRTPGAKEAAIREELGLAPVRYYQLLNGLLDRPAALAHDALLVNRLRRLREARRGRR
ncbi:DUF3263 domain-containing protein [Streptacidiphilus sp. N1-3]|uniref:DUF3263 domain-containing protein n=1 Tax=Streptacidiphilus alkalitolerans TaxID=3342712 RepID=A0ABV6X5W7_9ACTN